MACAFSSGDMCNIVEINNCNQTLDCLQHNQCQYMYPYIYKCGEDKCFMEKKICGEYLLVDKYLASIQRQFKLPISVRNHMKHREIKFKKFQKKIKNCYDATGYDANYQLNPESVCLRRKKCFKPKKPSAFFGLLGQKQSYMKIDCPCDGEESYECGPDYCTPNKYVCDLVNEMRLQNNTKLTGVQRCKFSNF